MFISTFLMHSPFAQTVHYSFTFSFTLPSYLLRSMIHQGEQLAPGNLSLVENVRLKYELYCARAPCMQIKYCLKTLSQYLAIVVTLSRGLSSWSLFLRLAGDRKLSDSLALTKSRYVSYSGVSLNFSWKKKNSFFFFPRPLENAVHRVWYNSTWTGSLLVSNESHQSFFGLFRSPVFFESKIRK